MDIWSAGIRNRLFLTFIFSSTELYLYILTEKTRIFIIEIKGDLITFWAIWDFKNWRPRHEYDYPFQGKKKRDCTSSNDLAGFLC